MKVPHRLAAGKNLCTPWRLKGAWLALVWRLDFWRQIGRGMLRLGLRSIGFGKRRICFRGVLLGDDARKELRRIVVVGADVLVRGT
jgi:hypothetical protein